MNEKKMMKNNLIKKICGEIVLSHKPGFIIKKWRNIFKVSQKELANEMNVTPSVISDYESNRRASPGIKIINKIVNSLIKLSEKKGGEFLNEFYTISGENLLLSDIFNIREFKMPVTIREFCDKTDSIIITNEDLSDNNIYGYSLIDSLKAILELSPMDLVKIYGYTTNRALIFSNITSGKSSMVAIKVTNLRPSLVVLHEPDKIDKIAKRISEVEGIVLAVNETKKVDELKRILKKGFE